MHGRLAKELPSFLRIMLREICVQFRNERRKLILKNWSQRLSILRTLICEEYLYEEYFNMRLRLSNAKIYQRDVQRYSLKYRDIYTILLPVE